jgi:hypothetical protein
MEPCPQSVDYQGLSSVSNCPTEIRDVIGFGEGMISVEVNDRKT